MRYAVCKWGMSFLLRICYGTSKPLVISMAFTSISTGVAGNRKPLKIASPPLYFNHGGTGVRDLEQTKSVLVSVMQWIVPSSFMLDYSHVVHSSPVSSSLFSSSLILHIYRLYFQTILDIIIKLKRRFHFYIMRMRPKIANIISTGVLPCV